MGEAGFHSATVELWPIATRLTPARYWLMPLLSGLDFVQVEELSEKILEAESMEEIRQWLEAARNN
jgi:hypothetical protein